MTHDSGTQDSGIKVGSVAEAPFAVHDISALLADYISRLGNTWIEGQISEVRETRTLTFMKLRDTQDESTVPIYMTTQALHDLNWKVEQGARVIIQAKADWWTKKGTLQFKILQIRSVGLGELMARLEALRNILAAEGLFAPERKKELPFLPRRIGLICGQNSDAMHDVIENSKRRWPDVEFVVREVPVQGPTAVRQVCDAITELDAIDDVDVIVVARGGGSFEDLLPFSDETLIRTVAACVTPVVAAIGHEEDRPLIDYVADYRASTPTDAARRIVPDVVTEIAQLRNLRSQMFRAVEIRLSAHAKDIATIRSKPALAHPSYLVEQRIVQVMNTRGRIGNHVLNKIDLLQAQLVGAQTALRTLSPQGTLERGYAIVRDHDGTVIRLSDSVASSQRLSVRVSSGEFDVVVQ
ncbi:MAG: exodeoxyribonuclease VII large subunit [Actinobacteria bacterium]|uniref:Unannotated protein n=1 Tax=freshwater metagenome TaxID=449393 RepID=A0A6J5YLR7_9ZZZZ|nr:exodeoxyribonuclease VII large subunit [Actinomycetota bacterium]